MKTLIRHQGEIYVVAGHKKCEKGTHWNEEKKQCLKLPPSLLEKHKTAMSLHKKAHNLTDRANKSESLDLHHDAYKAHVAADKAHAAASTRAYHKGFTPLANMHDSQSNKHNDIAEKHAKHVGRHFKDHLVVD